MAHLAFSKPKPETPGFFPGDTMTPQQRSAEADLGDSVALYRDMEYP